MLRAHHQSLVVITLLGACAPVSVQESCPELSHLRAEAERAFNKATEPVVQDRCAAYVHYSVASAEIRRYAYNHHELCGVSAASLRDIDSSHHRAVAERESACGGHRDLSIERKRGLFPPEIRPHR